MYSLLNLETNEQFTTEFDNEFDAEMTALRLQGKWIVVKNLDRRHSVLSAMWTLGGVFK